MRTPRDDRCQRNKQAIADVRESRPRQGNQKWRADSRMTSSPRSVRRPVSASDSGVGTARAVIGGNVVSGRDALAFLTATARTVVCTVLIVLIVFISACDFVTEAEFSLDQNSRLPVWFTLPDGAQRSQCSVRYTIYGPARVRMRLYGPNGSKLADVRPLFEGRVDQTDVQGKSIDNVFDRYPSYTLLSYKGHTEVIEIRTMGPTFEVVDDRDLIATVNRLVTSKK